MSKRDSIVCKFCQSIISDQCWSSHINAKKHKKRTPSSILVQGILETEQIDEAHEYFAQFGKISSKHVDVIDEFQNIVVLDYVFENQMSHSVVVHKEHILFGNKMTVLWNPIEKKGKKKNKKLVVTRTKILVDTTPLEYFLIDLGNAFRCKNHTFAEQITIFEKLLQVHNSKLESTRERIINDLATTLIDYYSSDCRVRVFGSTESKLDIPTSSLDFYIYNMEEITKTAKTRTLQNAIRQDLRLEGTKRVMKNGIDVLVFGHVKTRILCRLTSCRLMVQSHELIRYYLNLDEKIRPLVLLVKCWATYNYRCRRELNPFSNHALYLLVIFFLQQEPFNLPSVMDLQQNVFCEVGTSGYNSAFVLLEVNSQALKSVSVFELVNRFFTFYSNFDYVSYVAAPYCGQPIEKSCFLKPYNLPTCYSHYMNRQVDIDLDYGICIQDPFDHSKNVTYPSLSYSGIFISWCLSVATLPQTHPGLLSTFIHHLDYPKFTILKPEEYSNSDFRTTIEKLTSDILSKVFCYTVRKGCVSQFKIERDKVKFTCDGDHNLWENRCKVLKILQSVLENFSVDVSDLRKEIDITTLMVNKDASVIKLQKNSVMIYIEFKENPSRAEFVREGKCKDGRHFDHFLRLKITQFFEEQRESAVVESPDTSQNDTTINEEIVESQENSLTTCQIFETEIVKQEENKETTTYEVSSSSQFLITNSDPEIKQESSTDDSSMSGLEDGELDYDALEELLNEKEESPLNNLYCDSVCDETYTKRSKHSNSRSRSRSRSYDTQHTSSRSYTSKEKETLPSSVDSGSVCDETNTKCNENSNSRSKSISRSYDRRRKRSRSYTARSRSRSRQRKRLKRSRSRSNSPDSRYSRSSYRSRRHSPPKRKSFLEEIRDKLDVIGSGTSSANTCSLSGFNMLYPAPPPSVYQVTEAEVPQCDLTVLSGTNQSSAVSDQTSEHVDKVISERKTVFPHQHNQGLVLSQCEKALRAMSHARLRRFQKPEALTKPQKHVSPLLKRAAKFSFTSLLQNPCRSPFAEILLNILHSIGVLKQAKTINTLIDSVAEDLTSGAIINDAIAAKILHISLLSSLKGSVLNGDCEKLHVGTQCIHQKSVDVQISEEDLVPKISDKCEYILENEKTAKDVQKKNVLKQRTRWQS